MKKVIVFSVLVMFLFAGMAVYAAPLNVTGAKTTAKKDDKKKSDDPTVYATEKGKKYHKKNCKVVKEGKKGLKLSEAIKKGLEPCAVCKPPTKKKKKKKK